MWTLLLQYAFTGKAQEVYAALSPGNSLDYEHVKAGILRAYELVPQAYVCLTSLKHTFFARKKEVLFDR